jgi:hypothetical protein
MDNIEASCFIYVKVSTFTHLAQSKTTLVTVNQSGMVRLIVRHNLIVSVGFMYYSGDHLRQTSADVVSFEQCPMYREQSCDFGGPTA